MVTTLSSFRGAVPYLFSGLRLSVQIVSVVTMAIYLALRPALYREGLIALIPPVHRELARNLLADLSRSLRAWIVGQLIMMSSLGFLTWVGDRKSTRLNSSHVAISYAV